jgi:agmatine deiminase
MSAHETPRELGYTFPPEWHPHAGTWLSWPRPEGISFPGRYENILPNLAGIVAAIGKREAVNINVPDAEWEARVREQLAGQDVGADVMSRVRFWHIPTNENWCRDHGPAFVMAGVGRARLPPSRPAAIVDWKFNAWGGKYPPWEDDDAVPTRVAQKLGLPVFDAPIVMEGGAVDFNGEGIILTTEDCLLNPNRNPGVSKAEIERHLLDYFGQQEVLWLRGGIVGDDTDGHIDDLARFVNPRTIVVGVEEDPADENYPVTRDAAAQCRSLRDAAGRGFEVVELPMPGVFAIEEQRVPATYVNFYFVNGALLVPTFGHENDGKALDILSRLLPGREVVGVDCRELIWGLGTIHCLTQQQPAW